MDSTLGLAGQEATRNADWYTAQAAKAKISLDAADAAKTDYERENGIVMQDDKNDLDTARLRSLAGQAPIAPPIYVAPPPSATAAQLVQLDFADRAERRRCLGANHPELVEMRARRASLATLVAQEQAASRAQAAAAAAGAGALDRALQQQKTRVIAQRDKLERLTQLQSEVVLRRDMYNKTMARAAQFRQEAAAADTGISLMGNAVTPQTPSFPNKPLIMFGSLGLGAGMGVLVGLLLELLEPPGSWHRRPALGGRCALADGGLQAQAQVVQQAAARQPSHGGGRRQGGPGMRRGAVMQLDIPTDDERMFAPSSQAYGFDSSLVTISEPFEARAEAIRALRTHVMAQHVNEGRRALAVCAASAGVGCTFIATNLAVALSQIGVKTLIIDGDLRNPGIDRIIQPPSLRAGLRQCLASSEHDFGAYVEADVMPNLSVMYAGGVAPQPQELLASEQFTALMDYCLRDFDATIVDTPPANSCSDARRISTVAGYSVIVARRHRSLVNDVKTLAGQLQGDHARIVGTVLNEG